MNTVIRQHLNIARDRMKHQTNKRQTEHEFAVGDLIYMKLQPYVQASVMPRANQKLSFKYFGPFPVLEWVGLVACILQLPPNSAIHPIVHVSQLRLASGFKGSVSTDLPSDMLQYRIPLQVLGSWMITRGGNQVTQVKLSWSRLTDDLTTWEDYSLLKQIFPDVPTWGQAVFQGEGNVSTEQEPDVPVDGPRRSIWPKKPNVRILGPEWEVGVRVTCGV
jgi:hypothetical protein